MRKIVIILSLLFLFYLTPHIEAKKYSTLNPSSAFYVHDDNYALLTATQYQIFYSSTNLYENSLTVSDKKIQGAQVVVVTLDENSLINTTTLFNEWEIGKNNMGLLLVLYYDFSDEVPQLTSISFEAGTQMLNYITAFDFRLLYDEFVEPFMDEISIMQLYYEILSHLYTHVYPEFSFSYDLDGYIDIMYDYFKLPLSVQSKKDQVPIWLIITIVILVPSLGLGSFFTIKSLKGGGGKSIGYKYRT